MFKLLYEKLFLQWTEFSEKADTRLEEKVYEFLQDKELEHIKKSELEELILVIAGIGHEEGFLCGIEFLGRFLNALVGKDESKDGSTVCR